MYPTWERLHGTALHCAKSPQKPTPKEQDWIRKHVLQQLLATRLYTCSGSIGQLGRHWGWFKGLPRSPSFVCADQMLCRKQDQSSRQTTTGGEYYRFYNRMGTMHEEGFLNFFKCQTEATKKPYRMEKVSYKQKCSLLTGCTNCHKISHFTRDITSNRHALERYVGPLCMGLPCTWSHYKTQNVAYVQRYNVSCTL